MKKNILKNISLTLTFILAMAAFAGCGSSEDENMDQSADTPTLITENTSDTNSDTDSYVDDEPESSIDATELTVIFGDGGAPFIMHLYDNDTARAIARHVGTADWRLPIYHYDDYENWEVMQYYDIPSRYEIPSAPETITEEAAGTVYYSEPNRIILFYGDAEVTSEYTPVGYFDNTEEFRSAVENNPVLEGWGNKIVLISDGDLLPIEKRKIMSFNRPDAALIQNLKDAGCDTQTIENFMSDLHKGKEESSLKQLAIHRKKLLDSIHKEQKQIDCLDYLVYQMRKSNI